MIDVQNLKKHFKTFKKEAGFAGSLNSLVNRKYVSVKALDGISFGIKKGEIRGFIGPNGAGKSTTIKILSGILYPTSGKVMVNGFNPWKERENYVKRIGVVFGQKQQLWLDLPASDTFQLNKALYDIPEKTFRKNLNYFVKLFELKEIIKRPARQLSLGEKMKCELISSLLHDPDVVFLDEPTIGLDIISKDKIRTFIKQVNRDKNITFLLTTHDLDDIENLCENILIINKGRIVFDGNLSNLRKKAIKTKILDIKFKQNGKDIDSCINIEGVKVLSKNGISASLEVNLKKQKIEKVIETILKNCQIRDININNPGIDSVIKTIYEKK